MTKTYEYAPNAFCDELVQEGGLVAIENPCLAARGLEHARPLCFQLEEPRPLDRSKLTVEQCYKSRR